MHPLPFIIFQATTSPTTRNIISSLASHQILYTPPAKEGGILSVKSILPKSLFEDPRTCSVTSTTNEYDVFPNVSSNIQYNKLIMQYFEEYDKAPVKDTILMNVYKGIIDNGNRFHNNDGGFLGLPVILSKIPSALDYRLGKSKSK
jgi:hypothetical protein